MLVRKQGKSLVTSVSSEHESVLVFQSVGDRTEFILDYLLQLAIICL